MKEMLLYGKRSNGRKTKLDDDDYEKYKGLRWYLSDTGYAVRRKNGETFRLHRLIMNCPEGLVIDHLNGDKLDNRKNNLRICTQLENARNKHGTKGYCFDKTKNKYMVRYHNKFYGRYATEEEAKEAFRLAKSGKEYEKNRRKFNMLPKHISKQFGKFRVGIQKDGIRYRKTGFNTLQEAISWRDNMYKILEKED